LASIYAEGVRTVIVTTTVDSEDAAAQLARGAVEIRLAACGQMTGPITSSYWWQGELETATEWTVAFKTTDTAAPALIEHVKRVHPYDVPEVLVTPVMGGNPAYLDWVAAETSAD
jgi:periplasmic divalent cation tolerance protein